VETALRELNELVKNGKDLARLMADLLNHFRNLLIYQVSRGDLKLLEISEVEAGALKDQASLVTTEALTRIMEVLTDYEGRLRDAAAKKIMVEVALCKAIEARNTISLDVVLKKLNELRSGTSGPATAAPAPAAPISARPAPRAAAPPPRPAPVAPPAAALAETPAPAPATVAGQTPNLDTLWAQLIEAVGRVSTFTRSYLLEAHPVSFVKNVFCIGFDPEFEDKLTLVDNPRNHTLLQTKLAELGHPNSQIKFIKADAPEGYQLPAVTTPPLPKPAAPAPTPPSPVAAKANGAKADPAAAAKEKLAPVSFSQEDFKNDPLIQKALEVFKGQIVEVRA
ncbi:MAG TPA: hypothetical protein VL527_11240, partial [Dongiaceae bacterium]|nr:hypothetical protein [Dongiaceae bacterium]